MTVTPKYDAATYTNHMGNSDGAALVVAYPPTMLVTSLTNPRIRVDVGQTGFYEGREFRAFVHETALAAPVTIQIVLPVNVILFGLSLDIIEGQLLVETISGGTPSGTFGTPLTVFPRNTMTDRPLPVYAAQVTMARGGSVTGGTVLDVLEAKTAGNSNFANSVGDSTGDERGVAPGTYYFRLTPTGTTHFILRVRWEERP